MHYRPQFNEYVMAKLVTLSVVIFAIFSLLLYLFIEDTIQVFLLMTFVAIAFVSFVYSIAHASQRMQEELVMINRHLMHMDKAGEIAYKSQYFTKEFEDIHQSLSKVLEASKKREAVKQRYTAKLKLKNTQRGDMISAIAHEFRNPIASIMGYAQTLVDDGEIPPPLRDKFLKKINNNGIKIEALLSRLVLWNKFESAEATLHPTSFDMHSLLEEVKINLKEKYPSRNIRIDADSFKVTADRTLIDIVLKNLIENALKYSQEDILVTFIKGKVSVKDEGGGIASEELGKVTKKFYRSKVHTWDNSMGLGLSIVKSILTLHKSELTIESKEGEGSTFSFTLFFETREAYLKLY
ncbi:MAG: HAMP domain-containing sensor histidine kinase [Sulfurovum sp.]|nr:HAMP domain-containing sensor histidine kinase [Sulfurovum sp.]